MEYPTCHWYNLGILTGRKACVYTEDRCVYKWLVWYSMTYHSTALHNYVDCAFQQRISNAIITCCLPARVLRHTSMFPVTSLAVHRHVESHRWRTRRESNWTMAAQYPGLFSQFFMDALSLMLPSVLTEHLVSVFVLTMRAQGFNGRRWLDAILGMVEMDYRRFCIFLWYTYFIGQSIHIHYIYFYATLNYFKLHTYKLHLYQTLSQHTNS